jgi:hypothetical protein
MFSAIDSNQVLVLPNVLFSGIQKKHTFSRFDCRTKPESLYCISGIAVVPWIERVQIYPRHLVVNLEPVYIRPPTLSSRINQPKWKTPPHCKKKVSGFPVPRREMSLNKLSLAGIFEFFPARESLISDIQAGDGKTDNFFYSALPLFCTQSISPNWFLFSFITCPLSTSTDLTIIYAIVWRRYVIDQNDRKC